MKLEPASIDDCNNLLSLSKERMRHYFIQSSMEWNDQKRMEYLRESDVFRIINPKFCGYLQLCEKQEALFIYDLQIFSGFQGKGTGTTVIRSVFKLAKTKEIVAVRLGSFKSNPATNLYERLGFEIIKQNEYFAWYGYNVT